MVCIVKVNGRVMGMYPGSLAEAFMLYDVFQLYSRDFPMVTVMTA